MRGRGDSSRARLVVLHCLASAARLNQWHVGSSLLIGPLEVTLVVLYCATAG